MKLTKWLTPLSIATLAIASGSFGLVSCGDNGNEPGPTPPEPDEPWTDETPYEYIHNRTFSIERIKNGNAVWGTCWIIDDSTPNKNDDYCYYVATNWHVTHGFDRINDNTYFYADDSLKSPEGWIEHEDYIRFASYQQLSEQNFLYKDETQTEYFKKGIDLYVCNVNFGAPSGSIKTKLDTLNSIRQEKGQINKFVNSDDEKILIKRKIVGGYPFYSNGGSGPELEGGGQWEYHDDITSDLYSIINRKGYGFKYPMRADLQIGHPIGQPKFMQDGIQVPGGYYDLPEEFYFYDIAPQYHFKNPISPDWMKGGASGSMLITEDCEVCGIYWGGEASSDGDQFWPYFSLFKTSDYDFTQQWLDN